MKIATANIKNYPDMPPSKVRLDAAEVGRNCTIWGGQEISPEDHSVVLGALKSLNSHWSVSGAKWETPLFFRSDIWEISLQQATHLPRPDMKLVAKNSAAVGALFRNRERPKLKIAVVNTHLITRPTESREQVWREEFEKFRLQCLSYFDAGFTVFPLGDFNNRATPIPIKGGGCRWLAGDTGNGRIDKIGVCQAPKTGATVKSASHYLRDLHSDHPLMVVDVEMSV